MKIDSKVITPSKSKALTFRTNCWELELLKSLVELSLEHTPRTPDTKDTITRLRNMSKAFNTDVVENWLKENKV